MEYDNIKKIGIKVKEIADDFDYADSNSLHHSSAKKRILTGVDRIIGRVLKHINDLKG